MSISSIAAAAESHPWWTSLVTGDAGVSPPTKPAEEVTPVQVESAVRELNVSLADRSVGIQFELDAETHKIIVRVVDRESGEVIRQIPNEEVVRMARIMGKAPGLLMSDRV